MTQLYFISCKKDGQVFYLHAGDFNYINNLDNLARAKLVWKTSFPTNVGRFVDRKVADEWLDIVNNIHPSIEYQVVGLKT